MNHNFLTVFLCYNMGGGCDNGTAGKNKLQHLIRCETLWSFESIAGNPTTRHTVLVFIAATAAVPSLMIATLRCWSYEIDLLLLLLLHIIVCTKFKRKKCYSKKIYIFFFLVFLKLRLQRRRSRWRSRQFFLISWLIWIRKF